MFEVRYGNDHIKVFKTNSEKQAADFYNKMIIFAKNHNLSWGVALWKSNTLVKYVGKTFKYGI